MPELQRESLDAILAALRCCARVTGMAEGLADIDERLSALEHAAIENITAEQPLRTETSESLLGICC